MDDYRQQLSIDAEGKKLGEKESEWLTTDRSVLIQDLSDSRPVKLYMIAINGEKSSTTLVVSRSEDEEKTYIGWSNYRQLWP